MANTPKAIIVENVDVDLLKAQAEGVEDIMTFLMENDADGRLVEVSEGVANLLAYMAYNSTHLNRPWY